MENKESSIKRASTKVKEAIEVIEMFQSGKLRPTLTYDDNLNRICLGGLRAGEVIVIAASSGMGKSHFVQHSIEAAVFDKELNPMCDEVVLLKCNWEMSVQNLLLRSMSKFLNKSIGRILHEEFTDLEYTQLQPVVEMEAHSNIYYLEDAMTADDWYQEVLDFCTFHKDKRQIIITIDHIALVLGRSSAKHSNIGDLLANINKLKKIHNVTFVILSQLNSNIEKRENPMLQQPIPSDLFYSSEIFQLATVVMVLNNPYKRGMETYMRIRGFEGDRNKPKYHYLSDFMVNPEDDYTSFFTEGLIFHHYLKVRYDTSFSEFSDLFIIPMDLYKDNVKVNNKEVIADRRSSEITRSDDFLDYLD